MAESRKIINFKAPPTLDKNISYTKWKKEIAVWEAFTDLEASRRAPAIFLTLEGQARDAVIEMEISEMKHADGTIAIVDENYILESLIEPQKKIVEGYQGVMPSYKGILRDREIQGVIEYIKSLK